MKTTRVLKKRTDIDKRQRGFVLCVCVGLLVLVLVLVCVSVSVLVLVCARC